MFDLKTLNSALEQLEADRGIPKEKVIEAVEDALAAAYKKDYGKRGQVIRARFDLATGKTDFEQSKTVVDESMVKILDEQEEYEEKHKDERKRARTKEIANKEKEADSEEDEKKVRFNPEHHILLEDAKKIKKDASLEEEIIFPLESKGDYGRIAAQTAKQVIIQRLREAERLSVTEEYGKRKGEIVSGTVQRIERGNIYIDLGRATGLITYEEQIPGERFRIGARIQAYLYSVEETPRDIALNLSRAHPKFLHKLFEIEVPEIANGAVEIMEIAREAGARSKVAVVSHDEHIDPVGSCVGQRGVRVTTVMSELGGEKIDIIEWSDNASIFIERALSPARAEKVTLNEKAHQAIIEVDPDQYSLAIGKRGQNARLAAKLTGWKIDIRETTGAQNLKTDGEEIVSEEKEEEKEVSEEKTAVKTIKVVDEEKKTDGRKEKEENIEEGEKKNKKEAKKKDK